MFVACSWLNLNMWQNFQITDSRLSISENHPSLMTLFQCGCAFMHLVIYIVFSLFLNLHHLILLTFRHDILEGVAKLHLSLLLTSLADDKYISITHFNDRLLNCNYGWEIQLFYEVLYRRYFHYHLHMSVMLKIGIWQPWFLTLSE